MENFTQATGIRANTATRWSATTSVQTTAIYQRHRQAANGLRRNFLTEIRRSRKAAAEANLAPAEKCLSIALSERKHRHGHGA
jgi:hypothetical protein